VGIGGVERTLGCLMGGWEGILTGAMMECARTATAQRTAWQENANHFEVVLGRAVEEVVLNSFLGTQLVKCKATLLYAIVLRRCLPGRLAVDGYSP